MDKQTNFDDYTVPQKTLVDFGMTFADEQHTSKDDKLETDD
jgi:hypothetical protein